MVSWKLAASSRVGPPRAWSSTSWPGKVEYSVLVCFNRQQLLLATVKWAVDEVTMGPVAVLVAKMVQLKSKTSHGRVLKC